MKGEEAPFMPRGPVFMLDTMCARAQPTPGGREELAPTDVC
jgi:hypothetical protein